VSREKLLGAAAQSDYRDWLYRLEWQTKESDYVGGQMEDGQWLILSDRGGVGESIRALLESQGQRCVCAGVDDQVVLESTAEFPLRGVIHLWALDETEDQGRISGSVHRLVKAIAGVRLSPSPRLCLVTRGTQTVDSQVPAKSPAGATLWGLANVLAAEHPELHAVVLDLEPQPADDEARFIIEEALTSDRETRIAMRKGLRYVQRLTRIRPPASIPALPALNAGSTYLITGGLGAIGLKVAKWMVARGAKHLVLTGRSAGSAAALNAVDQMRKGGTEVLLRKVDVGDPGQVADLLAQIKKDMPVLRGVAHAAGVLHDGLIVQQDWDTFADVLRPKVQGAWNLHVQTLDGPLDFFLLFSSAAAFMPNAGQTSYSAANAFLDSLAHVRQGMGLPALSVNWGRWEGPGLAGETGKQEQNRLSTHGVGTIDAEQGLRALDFLFSGHDAQGVVLPLDWRKYFSHYREGAEPMLLSKLATEIRGRAEDEKVQNERVQLLQRLQQSTAPERQEIVEDFIAQQVMEVLGFKSRQEVELSVGFFEIGLDSMMAVELQSRIQSGLGVSIPATTAFDQPNITALARYLLDTFLVFEAPPQSAKPETEDDLSEDQLLAFLGDELPEQISTAGRENS
jgi:NADP-dependent 3-hydroxy acid dehydrogenase YdfG/acyl carrier protein